MVKEQRCFILFVTTSIALIICASQLLVACSPINPYTKRIVIWDQEALIASIPRRTSR